MFPCIRYRRTHAFHTSSLLCRRSKIATWAFLVVLPFATEHDDSICVHFSFTFRTEIHANHSFAIATRTEEEMPPLNETDAVIAYFSAL